MSAAELDLGGRYDLHSDTTGWLYLAVLLNLYSRSAVGWSMGNCPNEALTLGALNMAIEQLVPKAGLIDHMDQGAIYRSQKYREQMQTQEYYSPLAQKAVLTTMRWPKDSFRT